MSVHDSNASSPRIRKKLDLREIGHTIRNLFKRSRDVKPINSFSTSNLAKSYKKHYLQNEDIPLEIKVRILERNYGGRRLKIDCREVRHRRKLTPYKRSHSCTRTVHDTDEYVEENYGLIAVIAGHSDPYPFPTHADYPRPQATKTVQGHFSQRNIPMWVRRSRHPNEQCTSMAYTAVIAAKKLPTTLWTPEMLDRVIVYGDRLHQRTLRDMKWKKGQSERLFLEQLKENPRTNRSEWPVKVLKRKLLHGILKPKNAEEREMLRITEGHSLESAIKECFDSSPDGCVLTVGDLSTAILRDPIGRPCVFDSHHNDASGRGYYYGAASLYKFDSIEHVADYYSSQHYASASFNILGLEVQDRSPEMPVN